MLAVELGAIARAEDKTQESSTQSGSTQQESPPTVTFEPPPGQDAPETTTAGGKRIRPLCPGDSVATGIPLIPLAPANRFGLTIASHPTIFVYVPATSARVAEFHIKNTNDETVYRDTIALPRQPQLLSITLPPTVEALEPGRDYRWTFSLMCDPSNRQQDRSVAAWIHRIRLSPDRTARLEEVEPERRALVYARSGIWYDALERLITQADRAQSPEFQAARLELLQSAGLGFLAQERPQTIPR